MGLGLVMVLVGALALWARLLVVIVRFAVKAVWMTFVLTSKVVLWADAKAKPARKKATQHAPRDSFADFNAHDLRIVDDKRK